MASLWSALKGTTKKKENSYYDQDVERTIKYFQGQLRQDTQKFTYDDGREKELFALDGTIPVKVKGVTYNIPVSVLLQEDHPNVPPLVYVRPTRSMAITESQYVDTSGRVYHPYLHEWNHKTSTIKSFLQILCDVFAKNPPVYTKPAALRTDSQGNGQRLSPPACNRPSSSQQPQGLKNAEICPELLLGNCTMGSDCKRVHCPMPYCWQFKTSASCSWKNFGPCDNDAIEKLFCDVENLQVNIILTDTNFTSRGISVSPTMTADFEHMSMQFDTSTQFSLRRLSTPSYIQEPSNAFSTTWIWYWEDNNGWKKYAQRKNSSGTNQEDIETAYVNEHQIHCFNIGDFNYEIHFNTASMYQENMDPRYLTKRSVRRRPLFFSEYETQTTQSDLEGEDIDYIRIPADSGEFQVVSKLFHATIKEDKASILLIEKVKNDFLCERYNRKRDQMEKKLKASSYDIEKLLFHGTTSDVVDAICKHNFDHRMRGKNGTLYGEGSYFAVNASYSNNYSGQGGERFMFLASVLTGEYKLGGRDLRRPPLKDPSNPASDLYDSCVDNELNPKIFVIFNDEQCYPLYLIKYRLREP